MGVVGDSPSLVDRIDVLTRENHRLNDLSRELSVDNEQLGQQVTGLEDDLAAARTSLRRMIRDTNQQE